MLKLNYILGGKYIYQLLFPVHTHLDVCQHPAIEVFGKANNSSDVAISLSVLISYALLVGRKIHPSRVLVAGFWGAGSGERGHQSEGRTEQTGILVAARTCHILGRIK